MCYSKRILTKTLNVSFLTFYSTYLLKHVPQGGSSANKNEAGVSDGNENGRKVGEASGRQNQASHRKEKSRQQRTFEIN